MSEQEKHFSSWDKTPIDAQRRETRICASCLHEHPTPEVEANDGYCDGCALVWEATTA